MTRVAKETTRVALLWPRKDGDFPTIVTDSELQLYSVSRYNTADIVYQMGPGIMRVPKDVFDVIIEGEVTSYHVGPENLIRREKKKSNKISSSRRTHHSDKGAHVS